MFRLPRIITAESQRRQDGFLQVSYTGSPLRNPVAQTCSDYIPVFAVVGADVSFYKDCSADSSCGIRRRQAGL